MAFLDFFFVFLSLCFLLEVFRLADLGHLEGLLLVTGIEGGLGVVAVVTL